MIRITIWIQGPDLRYESARDDTDLLWIHLLLKCLECQLCASRHTCFIFCHYGGGVALWLGRWLRPVDICRSGLDNIISCYTYWLFSRILIIIWKNRSKSDIITCIISTPYCFSRITIQTCKKNISLIYVQPKTVNADCFDFELTVWSIGNSAQYSCDQRTIII